MQHAPNRVFLTETDIQKTLKIYSKYIIKSRTCSEATQIKITIKKAIDLASKKKLPGKVFPNWWKETMTICHSSKWIVLVLFGVTSNCRYLLLYGKGKSAELHSTEPAELKEMTVLLKLPLANVIKILVTINYNIDSLFTVP